MVKKSIDNVTAILIVFEPVAQALSNQISNASCSIVNPNAEDVGKAKNIPFENKGQQDSKSLPNIVGGKNSKGDKFGKLAEERTVRNLKLQSPVKNIGPNVLPKIPRHFSQPVTDGPKYRRKVSLFTSANAKAP